MMLCPTSLETKLAKGGDAYRIFFHHFLYPNLQVAQMKSTYT